ATPVEMDFGRCGWIANFSRTGAIRRSGRWQDPACDPIHATAKPGGVYCAGIALGVEFNEHQPCSHGNADAVESQLQHFELLGGEPGHPDGDEAIWPDHGR